jgi:thiamine-phosphate pyrophosphorylase
MELIVLSPEITVSNETEILNSLFENGLLKFHLRKPNSSLEELREYLSKVKDKYLNIIIINSHH